MHGILLKLCLVVSLLHVVGYVYNLVTITVLGMGFGRRNATQDSTNLMIELPFICIFQGGVTPHFFPGPPDTEKPIEILVCQIQE